MLWFTQVVFRWRTGASTVWLLLLVTPAVLVFQLLASCSPLHPVSWVTGWVREMLSLRGVVFTALYLVSLLALSLLYSLTYTVKLPVYKTRLHVLWSILQPSHVVVILLFTLLGGGGGLCLAEVGGYPRLWEPCQGYQRCLNEHLLFCALHGAFLGFSYGVNYFVSKEYFLVFPSIQQQKLFRLRGHLSSHLWDSFFCTLKGLRFYYPLYYFLVSYLKEKLVNTFNLHVRDDVCLSSVSGLLDLGLFLRLLLAGTLVHLSWSFGLRIFRVFQTEAVRFPVVATFSGEASRLLTIAMKAKSIPLLMHLGYLDLYQLAIHSALRRKQVYSLNQSGEPAVWDAISSECLSLLNTLTIKLGGKTEEERTTAPPAPSTSPLPHHMNGASPTQKGWPTLPVGALSPPGITRRVYNTEKARLWSYSPGVEGILGSPQAVQSTQPPTDVAKIAQKKLKEMQTGLKALPKKVAEKLKKKPFFAFFLMELPDTVNQELFADCRLQVWAVTGLSELAAASYTEDSYGVVQKSLPSILASLISLSQALDKHVTTPLSVSKSTRNVRIALEANGRYAIKTALQTALHRLAITFVKEKRSLQLSEEQMVYWNTFLGTSQHYSVN